MPRKYKNYKRRGLRRRAVRRGVGSRSGATKMTLGLTNVHKFKETTLLPSSFWVSASAGSNGTGFMTFALNDLNNIGSFRNLFDLYKLTGVKIKIIPKFNVSSGLDVNTSVQAGVLPVLYIAPNRDPYVPAPTSIGDILNDDGVKVIRLTKPVNLYIKDPKPAIMTDTNANIPIQLGVSNSKQFWLTTGGNAQKIDQSALPHFGFRWLLNNGAGTQTVVCEVYATYYFSMKEQD